MRRESPTLPGAGLCSEGATVTIYLEAYPVPHRWVEREDDLARVQHRDLPRLSAEALWRDRTHVEVTLACAPESWLRQLVSVPGADGLDWTTVRDWLVERLEAVRREEARRGRRPA